MKLLLVEDDITLANNLARALRGEGFSVDHLDRGQPAIDNLATLAPDLVILDLGLPDIDGTQVVRALRKRGVQLPILILTARDSTEDLVNSLDIGADDYLAKPFAMPELLARLRVLGRRVASNQTSTVTIGDVTLDLASHQVLVAAESRPVSRREYMVLKALMENAGRVLTKDALENKLYSWGEEIASNTIEVHISNLRKKLPEAFIQTVRGVGYTVPREQG